MNFKVEHAIIAILVLALLYYVFSHRSLLSDLSLVPHDNNPQLKIVKDEHQNWCGCYGKNTGDPCCEIYPGGNWTCRSNGTCSYPY